MLYVCVLLLPEFVRPQSRYLDRSILQHSITGLQPHTLYSISIHALYSNTEGPEITLSQQTGTFYSNKLIHTYEEKYIFCHGGITTAFDSTFFGLFLDLLTVSFCLKTPKHSFKGIS